MLALLGAVLTAPGGAVADSARASSKHAGEGAVTVAVGPSGGIAAGGGAPAPGPATVVPPKRPEPLPSGSSRGLDIGDNLALDSGIATVSHDAVRRAETEPFSAHGKLLTRFPGGDMASCSATVVNTPNDSVIVGAAHCVRAGFARWGRWARRVVFIPAYDRGRRPFGTFKARRIWVPNQYWRWENPNYDVAVIRLRPNERGRVARVVGARGWATGVSRFHRYRIFGYPAGSMGGEVMRTCTSRVHGIREQARGLPGPVPSRIICDMARGSSGGGWIYRGRYLNSVVGYANIGRPGILYGPYFGDAVRRLIRKAGRN